MSEVSQVRVLLVEDNPGDAVLAMELLREVSTPSFEVHHRETLEAAIESLADSPFDVILLDLSLPDGRGLETISKIRGAAGNVPIVVLSGLSDEGVALEAVQAGAQDYLVKGRGDGLSMARAIRYAIERKKTENELREAQRRAVIASRAKSEFIANVSHELRTPLNAIIGFSEIMAKETFGPINNVHYAEYVGDILESGRQLLAVINDILDFSKIEAGKRDLSEAYVDLGDVFESCHKIIGERASAAGLDLTLRCPKGSFILFADEKALKQIVLNLLSNAIKFTPPGGSVSACVEDLAAGDVQITVRDTGMGIDENDIPLVLSPFGQVESSYSRRFNGTGLGLPLAKSLAELHGGTLTIESRLGKGTSVHVRLPAERRLARRSQRAV